MEWYFQALVIVVASAVGNYLTTYFTKKAENLATKEDIRDITDKIESVRTTYAAQLEDIKTSNSQKIEQLKTDLAFVVQRRNARSEKQREAVEAFHNSVWNLLSEPIPFENFEAPLNDKNYATRRKREFDALNREIQRCFYTLLLYFPTAHQVAVAAKQVHLEYKKVVKEYTSRLESLVEAYLALQQFKTAENDARLEHVVDELRTVTLPLVEQAATLHGQFIAIANRHFESEGILGDTAS